MGIGKTGTPNQHYLDFCCNIAQNMRNDNAWQALVRSNLLCGPGTWM
jgi:hypothetical protein